MIERPHEEVVLPTPLFSEAQKGRLRFIRWMAFNGRMGRIPESRAMGVVAMSLIMDKKLPIEIILRENPKPHMPTVDLDQDSMFRKGPTSDYEQQHQ